MSLASLTRELGNLVIEKVAVTNRCIGSPVLRPPSSPNKRSPPPRRLEMLFLGTTGTGMSPNVVDINMKKEIVK